MRRFEFREFSKRKCVTAAVNAFLSCRIEIPFQFNVTFALFESKLVNKCLQIPYFKISQFISNIDISSFLLFVNFFIIVGANFLNLRDKYFRSLVLEEFWVNFPFHHFIKLVLL